MSFCPQCGKEIKKDASFCTQCGTKINEPVVQPAQVQLQTPPSKSKAPFIIIIALLVVIAFLLGGILISRFNTIAPDAAPTEPQNSATLTTEEATGDADDNTFTGIINSDGATCYLELEEPRSIRYAEDREPLFSEKIWFGDSDFKTFTEYNGMTVTLKGDVFNYRDGGTLMFENTPEIVSTSGTAQTIVKSSYYENWHSTDNSTKMWDAGKVLKSIIMKCDGVESCKVAFSSGTLEDVNTEGFGFFNPASVSINDVWMDDYEFDVFITPTEENVIIYFGTRNAPDIPGFTYTWSGEFVSGMMPLDEYIVQEGLVR